MELIITIIAVLLISFLFVQFSKKIKIPVVVGLIICGLVLDIDKIRVFLIEPNTKLIYHLGDIALISLMFIAGMESSWSILYKEKKDSLFIALFAATLPLLLGFFVSFALGFSFLVSAIVGICLCTTSEATKAKVLIDMNKLKTRVGSAMMGAGIVDDIIALSLFVLVTYLLKHFYLKENLLIIGAIIAFFIGILIEKWIGKHNLLVKSIERMLMYGLIPFFFVTIGLYFDIDSLIPNMTFFILIIIVAITGKIGGTLLSKPFVNFKMKQLHLIGWAMNSRGAVEIALALIAFRSNIIPSEVFSCLIIMALLTTLIFPFIMTRMIKKDKKIMN